MNAVAILMDENYDAVIGLYERCEQDSLAVLNGELC